MAAKMLVRICLVCIVACFAAVQVHAFAGEPLGGGETHQVSSMLLPLQKTVALDVGMALHDFKRIVVRFFFARVSAISAKQSTPNSRPP